MGHLENTVRRLRENPWKLIWSYHSFQTLPWLLLSLNIQNKILPLTYKGVSTSPPHLILVPPLPAFPMGQPGPSLLGHVIWLSALWGQEHGCFYLSQGPARSRSSINTVVWVDGRTAYPLEQMRCVLEYILADSTDFQTNPPISSLTHYKIKPFECIYNSFCLTLYLTWPLMFLWVRVSSWQGFYLSFFHRQKPNHHNPWLLYPFSYSQITRGRHHLLSSAYTPLTSWFTFLTADTCWIMKPSAFLLCILTFPWPKFQGECQSGRSQQIPAPTQTPGELRPSLLSCCMWFQPRHLYSTFQKNIRDTQGLPDLAQTRFFILSFTLSLNEWALSCHEFQCLESNIILFLLPFPIAQALLPLYACAVALLRRSANLTFRSV